MPSKMPPQQKNVELSSKTTQSTLGLAGAGRRGGNHALSTLLRSARTDALAASGALKVSSPTDPAEREAESIAAQVMRAPADSVPKIHRACSSCQEEEKSLHRAEAGHGPETAPNMVHDVLRQPGRPLDASALDFFEPRLGAELSHVRVHDDAKAAASADAVQAQAYTVGSHIVFADGEPAPGADGRGLLAHELVHVLQQGGTPASNDRSTVPLVSSGPVLRSVQVRDSAGPSAATIFRAQLEPTKSIHPEEEDAERLRNEGTQDCHRLLNSILELIKRLDHRYYELEEFDGGNPGHRERYEFVQKLLKHLIAMAGVICKEGEFHPQLKEDAERVANRPMPALRFQSEPGYRERVVRLLLEVGVPAAVVTVVIYAVIAALSVPNPFTPVVALIGASLAVLFFIGIGRRDDVPLGQATTASNTGPGDPATSGIKNETA